MALLDVYFCLYAYYQGLSQYTHPQPLLRRAERTARIS